MDFSPRALKGSCWHERICVRKRFELWGVMGFRGQFGVFAVDFSSRTWKGSRGGTIEYAFEEDH